VEETMSAAAQVIIAIIPIVGIVMGSVVIFFYLLWNHKRRILLIQAGQSLPEFDFLSFSLLAGILLFAVGITLSVFLFIVSGLNFGFLGGLIPLSCGIGLLAYYGIRRGGKAK
jgi:hypothetical protein